MTLFRHATGPLMRYRDGTLQIADLNPEIETHWRMSRWEVVKLGLKALLAGLVT